MKYAKSLTHFRSLRYLFLLLTLAVVAMAFAAADTPVQTQAALQSPTRQNTQSPTKPGLPNYDIRLAGKTGFDDFDLTSTSGRARAQQNAHARARLAAVDQFRNARPDIAQNVRAVANEFGTVKNLFIDGGTLSEPESDTPDNIARSFLNRHADLFAVNAADNASFKLVKEDNDHGTVFLDYTQTVDRIKVFQGQVQVVVNKNGEVLSVREGFLVDNQQVKLRPSLSEVEGIAKAFEYSGKRIDIPPVQTHRSGSQLEMSRFANPLDPGFQEVLSELNVVRAGDASHLAWHVYVDVGPAESYEVLVDAHNGELLLRNNLVSDAQGTVYTRSPNQGARQLVFFPNSWLGTSVVSTWDNVDACIDVDHNTDCDPVSGNGLLNGRAYAPNQDFTFPFLTPDDPRLYPAASVTNLFYFVNYIHDFSLTLGFDAASGNMEGIDRVSARSQSVNEDSSFNCRPDGTSPFILTGIFTTLTGEQRDSSVDSDVVFHEYGHGIAQRLIGNCYGLGGLQSGAMNEGWGDYFAITLGGDGAVGEYVAGDSKGLRRAKYSVPAAAVHDSYADLLLGGVFDFHEDGEVWAATLWDLRAQLGAATVDRLVVQGMKFTPLGPSFLNARDAILQADQNLNGGGNRCTIWTVFARHGMGFSASGNDGTTHNAAYDVPSSCGPPPVYEGYLDGADCLQIFGWAWDQNQPNTPINVDIYANNNYVATAAADRFRQDLFDAGKGNGYHAFVFLVPATLKNGQQQNISVKFAGTNTQLIWSPRSITCKACMFPNDVPQSTASGAGSTWEQGVEFSSSVTGKITQIKFWKASGEPSGNHVGHIWSTSGTQLATASFLSETSSGWQTATVSPALKISAGVRYRVTYNIQSVVAKTFNVFNNGPLNRPPFTIYGSYFCSPAGCFPTTGSTSNLFADIVFNSPQ